MKNKKYCFEFNDDEVESIENALLFYIANRRDFYRKYNNDEGFDKDRFCVLSLSLHDKFFNIIKENLL